MVKIKKKIIIIHPALAPYRLDFFNKINDKSDCKILFFRKKLDKFFDQKFLTNNINFKPIYLTKGIKIFKRDIKFGLLKILIREKPEIIISSEFGYGTLISIFYKKFFFKKKIKIYILSEENINLFNQRSFLRLMILKLCVNLVNGLILTHRHQEIKYFNKFKKIYFPTIHDEVKFKKKIKDSKISSNKIFNKYKLKNFKIISYVGRLEEEKNLFFLIKNFNKIKINNLCLFIVGYGSQLKKLKKIAKNNYSNNRIIFTGKLQGNNLHVMYNLTQILILPSKYEPFGAVVPEALMSGCKVLVSNKVGSKFLINNMSKGAIFNINSKVDFVNKFIFLIKKIKPKKNVNTKKDLLNFNFNKMVEKLLVKIN